MVNLLWFHFWPLIVYVFLCQRPIGAKNVGLRVQLIHKNSPNSPFYKSHKGGSFYQIPKKSKAPNDPFTRVTPNNGDYLMKLSLGTPPVDVYGLVDTGSDLVWAQCTPCQGCYKQKNPLFDPLKSKTYTPIPCDSKECNSLSRHSCSPKKLCIYGYSHAYSSVSKGLLARETVTFNSTSGDPFAVKGIVFGCGHNNTGNFNENVMGVIGLGGGPLSLVSQLGNLYGSTRFSQCLVPFHGDPNTSGTISFGNASLVSGEGVHTTRLFYDEGATRYYVTLEGISVNFTFVPFNTSHVIEAGNIMIDPATPTTYLPQDFYDRLVEELKKHISLPPIHDDPDLGSHLCYKSKTNMEWPFVSASFVDAEVNLKPIQTFIPIKEGVFCLAMAGTNGEPIFGNIAQSNLLIGYDLDRSEVSFKSTDCSKQ